MAFLREDRDIQLSGFGNILDSEALSYVLHDNSVARVEYNVNENDALIFLRVTCTDDSSGLFFAETWVWDRLLSQTNWMKEGF